MSFYFVAASRTVITTTLPFTLKCLHVKAFIVKYQLKCLVYISSSNNTKANISEMHPFRWISLSAELEDSNTSCVSINLFLCTFHSQNESMKMTKFILELTWGFKKKKKSYASYFTLALFTAMCNVAYNTNFWWNYTLLRLVFNCKTVDGT